MPFVDPNFYKDQFAVEGKFVALTFGLLSPNKGIERMLRAMPAILREFPNFFYIVLGATHPNLLREQGERYRISLERLAKDLGIKPNVSFYNRFVEINELIEFIGMADIYITPYLNPAKSPRARWRMPSDAEKPLSPPLTGMPKSCWQTDAGCSFRLTIQQRSLARSASFSATSPDGIPCGKRPTCSAAR